MVNTKATIEKMYKGKCSISEYQSQQDPVTKITKHQEVITIKDQPCKLSFKAVTTASQTDTVTTIVQNVKLFISPDIVIKPGSKVTATQNGITTEYKNSSIPALFTSHQEIQLELFKGWA